MKNEALLHTPTQWFDDVDDVALAVGKVKSGP
jgi:hypothetical protein